MDNKETEVAPRVNKALLPQYVGKAVRIVGQVMNVDPSTGFVLLQSSDGGQVQIQKNTMSSYDSVNGLVVEVVGRVRQDLSLEEYNMCVFEFPGQPKFDLGNYDQLVRLQQQHRDLF